MLLLRRVPTVLIAVLAVHCQGEGEGGCGAGCDEFADPPSNDDSATASDDDSAANPGDDDSAELADLAFEAVSDCGFGWRATFDATRMRPPGPASGDFVPPGSDTLQQLDASLAAVTNGDAVQTAALAASIGFDICQPAKSDVIVFSPAPSGVGRSALAWRPSATTDLVILLPHAWSDAGTLDLGLDLFDRLAARALVVAGAHPCSSAVPSGCSGSTLACGPEVSVHRASDMSHAVETDFLLYQRWLADRHGEATFVGLHRFEEAGVSISDGTAAASAADHPLRALHDVLIDEPAASPATTCNPGGGQPVETRACGEDDIPGRTLNGAVDACAGPAPLGAGRYVHVELGDAALLAREAMVAAFEVAFLPVEQ